MLGIVGVIIIWIVSYLFSRTLDGVEALGFGALPLFASSLWIASLVFIATAISLKDLSRQQNKLAFLIPRVFLLLVSGLVILNFCFIAIRYI